MAGGKFQIGHTTDSETESSSDGQQQQQQQPEPSRRRHRAVRQDEAAPDGGRTRRSRREREREPAASTSARPPPSQQPPTPREVSTGYHNDQPHPHSSHAARFPTLPGPSEGGSGHRDGTRRREGRSATVSNPVQPHRAGYAPVPPSTTTDRSDRNYAAHTYAPLAQPTLGTIQDLQVLSLDARGRPRPEQIDHVPGVHKRERAIDRDRNHDRERPATIYGGAGIGMLATPSSTRGPTLAAAVATPGRSRRVGGGGMAMTAEEDEQARERERAARSIPIPRTARKVEDEYIPQTTLYDNMGTKPDWEGGERREKEGKDKDRDGKRVEKGRREDERGRENGKGKSRAVAVDDEWDLGMGNGRTRRESIADYRDRDRERERDTGARPHSHYPTHPPPKQPLPAPPPHQSQNRKHQAYEQEELGELLYDLPIPPPLKKCEVCMQQYEADGEREHRKRCIRGVPGVGVVASTKRAQPSVVMSHSHHTSSNHNTNANGQRPGTGIGGGGYLAPPHPRTATGGLVAPDLSSEHLSFSSSMPFNPNRGRSGSNAAQPMPARQYGFYPVTNPSPKASYGW